MKKQTLITLFITSLVCSAQVTMRSITTYHTNGAQVVQWGISNTHTNRTYILLRANNLSDTNSWVLGSTPFSGEPNEIIKTINVGSNSFLRFYRTWDATDFIQQNPGRTLSSEFSETNFIDIQIPVLTETTNAPGDPNPE